MAPNNVNDDDVSKKKNWPNSDDDGSICLSQYRQNKMKNHGETNDDSIRKNKNRSIDRNIHWKNGWTMDVQLNQWRNMCRPMCLLIQRFVFSLWIQPDLKLCFNSNSV